MNFHRDKRKTVRLWIIKEVMMKYMGNGSGFKSIIITIFLSSASASPLYGVFPVASIFMKKGVNFSNVLILRGHVLQLKCQCFYLKCNVNKN